MQNLNIHPLLRSIKSKRPERILLLCYFDPVGISTVPENISYLQTFSMLSLDVYNFFGKVPPFKLSSDFPLDNYDVIVFHNTVTYNIENIKFIDKKLKNKLKDYEGLKVLFKQDEQYKAYSVSEFIGKINADLVFSCLPETEYKKVYPNEITGNIKFVSMLTGYVTPNMRQYNYRQTDKRPIDVGYRGSLQPIYFGRLAYEKRQIGEDFIRAATNSGLNLDISNEWADRFQGAEWIKFLARCKATLGAESGASIFDLNGEVEKTYKKIISQNGEHLHDPEWCERVLTLLNTYEGNIPYNQISPRHFESATTRTLQFLYEGEYSGIFHSYKHYMPVRKDLSNFEELKNVLNDEQIRIEITERAFEEVILNRNNWIESFAKKFDQEIIQTLFQKRGRSDTWLFAPPAETNVLLICSHHPHLDPRISWIADYAPNKITIHVLGIFDDPKKIEKCRSRTKSGGLEIVVNRVGSEEAWLTSINPSTDCINLGAAAISFLFQLVKSSKNVLKQYLGVTEDQPRFPNFKNYLLHFLRTSAALSFHGARFSNIDVIIATDLDTLPAGIVLKEYFNASLIYDAHEFWPENDTQNADWEKDFWRSLEKFLLPKVDFAITVSPNLAQYMTMQYGHKFIAVPNAEPIYFKQNSINPKRFVSTKDAVAFIYQGNYAFGRGLELLIEAWPDTDKRAHLFLRGNHNSYEDSLKKIAKSSELLNKRIFFLEPVTENELISSAQSADVGIIPYEPICINHKYCCPNKLSQYCQAEIPILANHTDFISEIVNKYKLGKVVDFENHAELIKAVNFLTFDQTERVKAGINAAKFAEKYFNWKTVSQPLYQKIEELNSQAIKTKNISNQAFFTQELTIPKNKLRNLIPTNLKEIYYFIYSNPSITRFKLFSIAMFFWRLLPRTIRSRLIS